MKIKTLLIVVLMFLPVAVFSQSTGTLKLFSEEPIIVYIDQVQTPNYSEISLVAGTHYVKAINGDEVKVYSQIVTIVANETTSILIESATVAPVAAPVYAQPTPVSNEPETPPVVEEPAPANSIYIGQVDERLPKNMDAPFGLKFGMAQNEANNILQTNVVQSKDGKGFTDYAYSTNDGYCLVEARYMDGKLFTVVVAYTTDYQKGNRVKVNKDELPFDEFNKMYATIVAHYGEPLTTVRKFDDGYAENDGKLLEALKKRKAFIYYYWVEPETGNNILLSMAYSTGPIAIMSYSSGSMGKEAKSRNLIINDYNYGKTYDENYYEKK